MGTTNSCVAVMEGTEAKVISNEEGERTTPSVVAFDKGLRLVGLPARNQAIMNPDNTLYATKRLIGRPYDDRMVSELQKSVSYKIVRGDKGDAWCFANGKKISPEEVAAIILGKMKETAETYLGSPVKKAVITVPAYFNDSQRQATKDAGRLAGLEVERIVNEPTAAALAYGVGKMDKGGNQTIAVYDLGGGTFDISILELSNKVFEVKATNGDTFLGGEDFDSRLLDFIITEFEKKENYNLKKDPIALQRVREASEKAKKELSSASKATVNIPYVATVNGKMLHLNTAISRQQYDRLVDDLIQRTIPPCEICLRDAGVTKSQVDEVILVGGMTRTPKVVDTVEKFFNKAPFKGVNPDESVAMGAAIQGGILEGKYTGLVLLDVTPLSLGIELHGGLFARIIPKNTSIPASKSQEFTTAHDGQTSVNTTVYQGEREIANQNKLLGEFVLSGIPPVKKGVPKIIVQFDIDANGIVHVSAKDKATGRENNIRIKTQGGLSEAEIQRMLKEAEIFEEKDKQRRQFIESKNKAETLINNCNNNASEYQLSPTGAAELKAAVEEVEKILAEEDNIDALTAAVSKLEEIQLRVFGEAYQSAAGKK